MYKNKIMLPHFNVPDANPAYDFGNYMSGAGGILSQSLNRMDKEQAVKEAMWQQNIDNLYKNEQSRIQEDQWGKEFGLKEAQLALQKAADARAAIAAKRQDAMYDAEGKILEAMQDPRTQAYGVKSEEQLDQGKVGKVFAPWTTSDKINIPTVDLDQQINKVAQLKAIDQMKELNPDYGSNLIDDVKNFSLSKWADGFVEANDKRRADNRAALRNFFKSDADKDKDKILNPGSEKPALPTMEELIAKNVEEIKKSTQATTKILPDASTMSLEEIGKNFGSGVKKSVTTSVDKPFRRTADERTVPLLEMYRTLPEGNIKEAVGHKIFQVRDNLETRDNTLSDTLMKQQYAQQNAQIKAQLEYEKAAALQALKDAKTPEEMAKLKAELRKIDSQIEYNQARTYDLQHKDDWF